MWTVLPSSPLSLAEQQRQLQSQPVVRSAAAKRGAAKLALGSRVAAAAAVVPGWARSWPSGTRNAMVVAAAVAAVAVALATTARRKGFAVPEDTRWRFGRRLLSKGAERSDRVAAGRSDRAAAGRPRLASAAALAAAPRCAPLLVAPRLLLLQLLTRQRLLTST